MTEKDCRAVSALFCAFLFGILALHLLLPDRARSETENRMLEQRPVLTAASVADGAFMESAEEYIADQFPGRDGWTGLKARVEQLLGKKEFRGVYLCGDTLIDRGDEPGEQAESNLAAVAAFAETAETPVRLGLIPAASEVWAEKLPSGAARPDQASFIAKAEETGVPAVDYFSALTEHRDEAIYYRTDHHWTSLGAYYGYTALCRALDEEPVELEALQPETVTRDFNGTLYSTSGVHWLTPDEIQRYVPQGAITVESWLESGMEEGALYDASYLTAKDKYSMFLGGNKPLCVVKNPDAATERTLLLVRDSYADAMAPFLALTFAEVHLIDLRYYRLSAADYAQEHGIDEIVVSYSVQNFITDRNLPLLGQ